MYSDFVGLSAEVLALRNQGDCVSDAAWQELRGRVDLARRVGDIDELDYRWLLANSRSV